jgi:hypothetical protein
MVPKNSPPFACDYRFIYRMDLRHGVCEADRTCFGLVQRGQDRLDLDIFFGQKINNNNTINNNNNNDKNNKKN